MVRHVTVGAIEAARITEEDMERVLTGLGSTPTGRRNRALMMLMCDMGLRVSEALALETRDVVRQAGQITHVLVRKGKGGKPAQQPVSPRAAAAIAAWIEDRDRQGIEAGPLLCTISRGRRMARFSVGDGELVPGRALEGAYVRSMVKEAGCQAELEVDLHPHLLRHWAITRYLRANKDLELTRRFARHADVTTTARVYAHLVQEDVDNGMQALPGNGIQAEEEQDATLAALMALLETLTPEQRAAVRTALE